MKNDNIFHPLAFIMDMWHFEILTKSWISDKRRFQIKVCIKKVSDKSSDKRRFQIKGFQIKV